MNPTILIRSVAATLAATTLLLAQSAPQPRAAARSAPSTNDRMQVRLAEVIAMLEEDDLTPAQRADARKKLEEIRARLRSSASVPLAPPATPAPPSGAARGFVEVAPAGTAKVVEVRTPPRAARIAVPVAPEAQDPAAPAQAPKPPKPPKAPKPAKAPKGEVLEVVDVTEAGAVEVRKLGGNDVLFVKSKGDGGEVMLVKPQQGQQAPQGEGVRTWTVKTEVGARDIKVLKAADGKQDIKVRVEAENQARTLRAKAQELRAAAEKLQADAKAQWPTVLRLDGAKLHLDGWRTRLDVGADKAERKGDLEAARVEAKAADGQTKRTRVMYTDAKELAERAEAEAKAGARSDRVRTYTVREKAADTVRDEVRARVAQQKAKEAAGYDDLQPVRGRIVRTKAADDGDDDAEIRKLIEEMRAEMREIRKLIEQMRKQATSATKRPAAGALFGQGAPGAAAMPGFGAFVRTPVGAQGGSAGVAPRALFGTTNVRGRKASAFGGTSGSWSTGTGGGGSDSSGVWSTGSSTGGGSSSPTSTGVWRLAPGKYVVEHAEHDEVPRRGGSSHVK